MDASIREATDDDIAAVQCVARESWHAAYDDLLGAKTVESVVDEWYETEGVEASVSRKDGRFLVAETDAGDVVAFAQAVLDDENETARLPRIYAHPDHWGDGLGSALLGRIESWVREQGGERLRLIVLADNEVGNAFYEKQGYRAVGSRESEIGDETYVDYLREKEL